MIYMLSQIAGALVTGLVIWMIGQGIQMLIGFDWAAAAAITATAAAFAAVQDSKLTALRLPTSRWQVPWQWKRFPRPVMATLFGFGIGTGVLTRIPFAVFHVVLIATALFADLGAALLIMLVYGMTRALTVAATSQLQLLIPEVRQRSTAINRFAPLVGYLNGISLAATTGLLIGSLP